MNRDLAKAQFAMEYLLVVGFSLLLIVPVSAMLYTEYQDQKTQMYQEHLLELARELTFQAQTLHYQGAPARTTVEAYFPPTIETATITDDYIEFKLSGSPNIVYAESAVRLVGNIRTGQGTHVFLLEAIDQNDLDPENDYVRITEQVS